MFRDPFFKKLGIIVVILFVIGLIGMATSPRCPGCGKRWDGTGTMKYCFGCQAKQAQSYSRYNSPSSGSSSNSDSSYRSSGIHTSCAYQSCPDYSIADSRYCSRHTCKFDGCNKKVCDPILGYCASHKVSETCAEPGCNRPKYKARNSNYCSAHYGDRLN